MHRFGNFILCVLAGVVCAGALAGEPPPTEPHKVMSLSYSPSGIATFSQFEKGIPEAVIRADLQRLVPFVAGIRTYSVEYGLDRVPAITKELGLKLSLGIGLGRDKAKNAAEIKRAITIINAYGADIERVYVGNETIIRHDLTAAEVVAYIKQVKAAVPAINIPFGTAEPWHIWLKYPELGAASDFIGAHLFGYWDGVPAIDAVRYLDERFDQLQAKFPAKTVVIAETGWPSGGSIHQAAVPTLAARAGYVRQFLRGAAGKSYDYNIVEAYDQPWKAPNEKGAVWGLFTDDGKPAFNFFSP